MGFQLRHCRWVRPSSMGRHEPTGKDIMRGEWKLRVGPTKASWFALIGLMDEAIRGLAYDHELYSLSRSVKAKGAC